ncbi:MAG: sel1 repeat family protein [Gammaproteobacteria bacterium]|nr:sel1 repeat family protein [Gammaproteobacteria bacterium]
MSELNEQAPVRRRNPLAWIVVIVVGLILFVFLGGDRRDVSVPDKIEDSPVVEVVDSSEGTIERSLILPPGMRAREYIVQIRAAGKPYPLAQVHDKAQDFQHDGSLADAHLLYFFAARENHLPAMMVMAKMSDPILFKAENSLLDEADAIQAFKWYSKAAELGQPAATKSIDKLRQWALDATATGNPEARQLLLNIQ